MKLYFLISRVRSNGSLLRHRRLCFYGSSTISGRESFGEVGEGRAVATASGMGERHDCLCGGNRADPSDLGMAHGLLLTRLTGQSASGQTSQGGVGSVSGARTRCCKDQEEACY